MANLESYKISKSYQDSYDSMYDSIGGNCAGFEGTVAVVGCVGGGVPVFSVFGLGVGTG
jgi:hypothetical protein